MNVRRVSFLLCVLTTLGVSPCFARTWKDQTGNYSIEGELFAFNEEHVIIEREDGQLGMFEISFFSDADQEYLRSEESASRSKTNLYEEQSWEMRGGYQLLGTLVDYTRTKVTIQRRRGKIYVNDRNFDTLPQVYQNIIMKSLGVFENIPDIDRPKFNQWVAKLLGDPKVFDIDGIVMELRDGNEYTIPFNLFSEKSLRLLKGGWDEWLEAHQEEDIEAKESESFRLQATAAAMLRNQQMANEIAMARYNLDLIRSGITSLWEVTLFPLPGNPAPPRWVLVQARNSLTATANALGQNPGFTSGPVRRIR